MLLTITVSFFIHTAALYSTFFVHLPFAFNVKSHIYPHNLYWNVNGLVLACVTSENFSRAYSSYLLEIKFVQFSRQRYKRGAMMFCSRDLRCYRHNKGIIEVGAPYARPIPLMIKKKLALGELWHKAMVIHNFVH